MRIAYVHGFAGTPDVWEGLGDGLRVTLPGHGVPLQPTWDTNIAAIGAAIGDIDVVVGYSLGARVALALVAENRVSRAILISVNPGIDDASRDARRVIDAGWASMLRERGLDVFLAAWESQPLFATQARANQ